MNLEITNIEGNCYATSSNVYDIYNKRKDPEIFEKLIDDLILVKYSDDEDLVNFIRSLEQDEKRIAILSLIDGDHALWSKMDAYINGCSDKMEHIKNVVKIINQFVKDGEVEKKKFGEVMTPITLVREMLDTLPKEVWSNPDLKWLDPCNGAGTFPFVIIYKLMNGLKEWEPDTEKRYKHIIENMIYVCELQSRNVFLWLCGVDPKDEYTTNTYWGSFLDKEFDEHMKNVWGVEKFDIVVGNPPYQNSSGNKGSNNTLWDKFVFKNIKNIRESGYLVFVHPSGWRDVDGTFKEVQNILKSKEIIYLELHNTKDGLKTFGAGTTYDFYCLKNSTNNDFKTLVKFQDNTSQYIDISKMEFIPNANIEYFNKLIALEGEERVNAVNYRSAYGADKNWVSKTKDDVYKYPVVYTTTKDGSINLRWSSLNNRGHYGIPKVIWSNGAASTPIIDYNGDYALTQWAYAIIDDIDNLENIKNAMMSDNFIKLMSLIDGGNHKYNKKVISTFKKDFWKEFIK